MSMMTSDPALPDSTLIEPAGEVPRGTIAALESVTPPVDQLTVETLGSVPPPGQILMNPNGLFWVLVTVTFSDTAPELTGRPQVPVIVQVRISLAENAPPVLIGTPAVPRVSTIRHGGSPMKGRGFVASASVVTPRAFGGDQDAGAGQFGIASPAQSACGSSRAT